jgi:hypothetical protein
MNSNPTPTRALRLVPKPEGAIDADAVAFAVMDHIDTMYPAMWLNVPKTARVSVRNVIVRTVMLEAGKTHDH